VRTRHDRPAVSDVPPPDAEVLIEQARRHHRRKLRVTTACPLLAIVAGAVIYGATSGDGPPTSAPGSVGRASPGPIATARWQDLVAAGRFPPGAEVTTVIRYGRELVAAGSIFGPGHLTGLGCTDACSPVVWTSTGRGPWREVFAARAPGSIAGERLVAIHGALLLFNSDEGTSLWRSTNGRHWQEVRLPQGMHAMAMSAVASNGLRVVATFSNKFAGGPVTAYGESDTVWTSADGAHWRQGAAPDQPAFASVAATSHGFVAAGTSRTTQNALTWHSTDGSAWSATRVGAPTGGVDEVAADESGFALEWISGITTADAAVQLWHSRSGLAWQRATVDGTLFTTFDGVMAPILSTSDGFVALGSTSTRMWWSRDGRAWTRLRMSAAPPANLEPQGAAPAGSSLLVIEQARRAGAGVPSGATSVWQITLTTSSTRP